MCMEAIPWTVEECENHAHTTNHYSAYHLQLLKSRLAIADKDAFAAVEVMQRFRDAPVDALDGAVRSGSGRAGKVNCISYLVVWFYNRHGYQC